MPNITTEQQKELDVWNASTASAKCQASKLYGIQNQQYIKGYIQGYSDAVDAAIESIRDGSWSWEAYQEHLKK